MDLRHCLTPLALLLASAATAQVSVTADIGVSTTWTANNVYSLQNDVYVTNGATLTIEPGTVIASSGPGSLVITRGSRIEARGTATAPIIFTSEADRATWMNGDPTTGTWRPSAFEWGNVTILGEAYVSENAIPTNTPSPSPSNYGTLEGLIAVPGSNRTRYGGGDDDDSSGALQFVSLRYSGRDLDPGNELNAVSLGGVGRGTVIDHVEVMNNVDDGIELFGGTVDLKYVSIWNVGDDSLDIDQGWRGRVQFGLIVQGYSLAESQGSGVGDNAIEMDGAEAADWQPVTTGAMFNLTVIGNPLGGDGLTAWRDGARMQFRQCIFMDGGEQLVRLDGNVPGGGYGAGGTLTFAQVWATPDTQTSTVNAPTNPPAFYRAQSGGNLAEITDSVLYRNLSASAYTTANAVGVFAPSSLNVVVTGTFASNVDAPIVEIQRGAPFTGGGAPVLPVTFLDPRPANNALVSLSSPPQDGFFTETAHRGAFAPGSAGTWLAGWTASEAYGFTGSPLVGTVECEAVPTSRGDRAEIRAYGSALAAANDLRLELNDVPAGALAIVFAGTAADFDPGALGSGNLCIDVATIGRFVGGPYSVLQANGSGLVGLDVDVTRIPTSSGFVAAAPGSTFLFQGWFRDGATGANASDAVRVTFQ